MTSQSLLRIGKCWLGSFVRTGSGTVSHHLSECFYEANSLVGAIEQTQQDYCLELVRAGKTPTSGS